MTKVKNTVTMSAIAVYVIMLIVWSKDIGDSVRNSIKNCIEIIIPSLYIFMILSDFIISSNLYALIGKPFSLISRYVFRLPVEYFSIFIIGSIGGYPIGAKLLVNMVTSGKIDKNTAEDMILYCYLSGPAFICGIVGIHIFSDIRPALLIFISILISNIIVAVINGLKREIPPKTVITPSIDISVDKFVVSIYNGGKGILSVCAIIIFFSSITCISEKIGLTCILTEFIDTFTSLDYSAGNSVVKSFIEISNVTSFSSDFRLIPIIASLLSFGGICVIVQLRGIISNHMSLKRFYIVRFLLIISTYLVCKILYVQIYKNDICVFLTRSEQDGQNSPISALFLLIMTILFLSNISIENKKKI